MEPTDVARAVAAVRSTATERGLLVDQVTVLHNSNKLALRLSPVDLFARVAPAGSEQALAVEISLAQRLVEAGAPVASLDPRLEPVVHNCDGFAVTFWTFHTTLDELAPTDFAAALVKLHAGMRTVDLATPHFSDRIAEAEHIVTDPALSPQLDAAGRALLTDTLADIRHRIAVANAPEQLLHGEPHPGNILSTANGPLFIDLETCCRGPIEFDLAHVPGEVSDRYPGLDHELLRECRRLVLAMVAAWRWDADDQFPDGLRHGRAMLELLGNGPPWPALAALAST